MTKKSKLAVMAASDQAHGFSMNSTPTDNRLYRGIICLLNGFLIFCATFGTIGGILNAFEVAYNLTAVFFILFFLCFTLAFLHYNKVFFNLFYPLIFILFTFTIMQNRILANSGFQSFVSVLYEEYSSYFELSASREAAIANTNSYLTVTVAAIFVGFVLALLINIAVSTHMSALTTILLTAPILQLGIYIEKYPSPIYFVPLVFSYIAIGILGSFRHYQIPQKKEERADFDLLLKEGIRHRSYRVNGWALLQTTMIFAVISLLFLICFYPISQRSVTASSAVNKVKKTSDDYVKIFVQSGMAGFFNRYESTGGLSEGRLGGVSSVRPDFQPDLKVTYTPYSYETVYLRAFVGVDYTGNSWKDSKDAMTNVSTLYETTEKTQDYMDFTTFLESIRLRNYMESGGRYALKGKMVVENLDADVNYSYTPYYTAQNDSFAIYNHVANAGAPLNQPRTYDYYPTVSELSDLTVPSQDMYEATLALDSDEISYLTAYRDYCYDTYTYVPENLMEPIRAVVEKTGYGSNAKDKGDLITDYFFNEYTYSMSPGATPYNADFIEYFLTKQDQGYCAHFASAATMILRYMGVPARYVEGYIISASDIAESERLDASYSDYMTGVSPIGETGVLEVEVTDASAHAWVEVYSDGFGWIVVDPTPPSNEDNDYSGFWSAFTNLFSVASPRGGGQQVDVTNNDNDIMRNFLASTNHLSMPLILLLIALILFYPMTALLRNLILYIRQRMAYRNGDYAKVAAYYYRRLVFALLKEGILIPQRVNAGQKHLTYTEKVEFFRTFPPQSLDDYLNRYDAATEYTSLLEKALYAKNGISREELLSFKERTREILKKIR